MTLGELTTEQKTQAVEAILRAITHQARMYDAMTDVENIIGDIDDFSGFLSDFTFGVGRGETPTVADFETGPDAADKFLQTFLDKVDS